MKNSLTFKFIRTFIFGLSLVFVNQNAFGQKDLNLKSDVESYKANEFLHQQIDVRTSPLPVNEGIKRKVNYSANLNGFLNSVPRPTSSIELVDKRTEYSQTLMNQDGSFSQVTSSRPIHFKQDNQWIPIDNSILPDGSNAFAFSNRNNTLKSFFPENLHDGFLTEIDSKQFKDMLDGQFYSSGGESIKFQNSHPELNVYNNTLSYALASHFRLDIRVENALRKVNYVIESADFLGQFTGEYLIIEEQMNLPAGWKLQEKDGIIQILDKTNAPVATIGKVVYFDAGSPDKINSKFQSTEYKFENVGEGNYILKAYVPMSWLTNPDRQFPLTIDPTLDASAAVNGYYLDDGGNNRQVTTSGAMVGSTVSDVQLTIIGEESYWGGSCSSWWQYQVTSAGGSSASGCNGATFSSAFDGENPNQTWTITATDLDGYTDYLTYGFSLLVTYIEPQNDPPVANFVANSTTAHLNQTITFSDLSTNNPTTWSWDFSPSSVTFQNGTDGQSQNPQVLFGASGLYRVTLIAENAYGFDDEIKVDYITVVDGYIIPSSGSSSITACSGSLFDSEGSAGDYLNNSDGSITIYPASVGQKVNITGTSTTETDWDYFYVYDGENTSATDLTGGGTSGLGVAFNYTSTDATGALTVRLTSDGSYVYGGIDATISCVTPCSGTPATPTAEVTQADYCTGTQGTISASGYELGSGISYDWEYSTNGGTTWTSTGLSNATIYSSTDDSQWRYITTCSNSGASSTSNIVIKTLATLTSGGDEAECGSFSGDLSASTNVGNVEWYAASSGGSAVSTGDNYSPGNGSTTTYYAASSGCPSVRTAITATVNANPVPSASASAAGVCSGSSVDLTATAGAVGSISSYSLTSSGGSYTTEKWMSITTGPNHSGTIVWSQGDVSLPTTGTQGLLTNESIDLNAYQGQTLYLNAFDRYADSWDGTTYSLTLDGVTVINNGGASPDDGANLDATSSWEDDPLTEIEVSEAFTVATGVGSSTFAWTSDVGAFTSSDQNPTGASPSETTTYTVTETDDNGCTGTATTEVTYDTPSTTSIAIGLAGQAGTSESSGATMRFDQGVTMTGTGNGTINICYNWDSDVAGSSYAGQDWTSGYEWTNTGGSFLNGGDNRTLYLRTKNVNNVTCYSDAVNIVVRKPLVSASSSMTSFSNCEGTAASAQSFTVTGEHLTGDLTVSPPTGFEVSKASGSGYSTSSISFTPVNGAVTNETVYVRVTAAASSGSPSGDITVSTAHNLDNASTTTSTTVSVSGTVTAVPSISSVTDGSNCGTGTVDLSAAVSNGTINWYAAASGGASLGSGTSFTTPSLSSTTTYYVDGTDGSCVTGSRTSVTASILANPVSGSLSVDLSESLSTQTINWTNSGTAEGTCRYYYQWSDDNASAPTGAWTAWDVTVNQSWAAGNAGANMNRVLWVKTITTSGVGCGTAETTPVSTDVINCKENGLSASASAGTVANLPFGETITYTTGAPLDGSFERLQYQWNGTGGAWTDWETSNPYDYTTNINAGQTLYVRSKIVGADLGGGACVDYTSAVETFIIDCASTSVTSVTSNEASSSTELTCVNTEISVTASGADSYTWSDGASTDASRDLTSGATYTVTGSFSNGCTSTADITITENTTTPGAYAGDDFTKGCTDNASGASIGVTDEAANYSTWSNGDDEGSGFDAWSISTTGTSGFFLGNPSSDGMGTTGIGTNAFGFYATGGDYLNASRPLTNSMAVGDELTFYWAMNWDANGGGKGFDFKSGGTTIFTVLNSGSTAAITTSSGGTADGNYGTTPMLVTLTRTSSSEYTFQMTGRSSGFTHSETISSSSAIDEVNIFIGAQNEGNGNRNIYFNKFNLAQSGATYAWTSTSGLSASNVAAPSANPTSTTTYTLTVTGSNGCENTDQVTVTVDNEEPSVVGSTSVTDVSTCGTTSLNVEVESNGASGTWSNDFIGVFDNSTDASTVFQSNTFNEDMTLTWTNTSGGCSGSTTTITARFNQPSATGSMDTDSWIWGGLTNSAWSNGSNWYKWDGSKWVIQGGSYPDAGCKIYIIPTSDVCVDSNPTNAAASIGDLNIQGGTFDFGSSSTTVTGNITNDGTITGGSGTVTMAASGDQTISGTGAVNFNNLTVNKSSGNLILSSTTNVGSTLTMTKGNIVNSQPLVLGSSSASPGTLSHSSGVITGEFRKYFANQTGSTFFPIGTSSNMRDVTVNFTSAPGSNQYLTASYVAGTPTLQDGSDYTGLPLTTDDGQLIQNYSEDGYWVINPTGDDYNSTINSASYTIDLHCKNLTVQPSDVSKVRIIKSAGSNTAGSHHASWTGLTNQSASGSASDFTVTGTSTGFSFFGAGSDDGNALPVELVSFSGACNDGVVELIWETASEYNSSHFDVENSRDGITWDVVKTIEAEGFSTELVVYNYNDINAHGGDNYYRLTQVDIDGTSKTYDVINVSCSQTTSGYFSIFPNPSSGSFQVMLNNSDIVGQAEMNIVDTKGNKVFTKSIDVKTGINMFVINENLAPGIYYVSVKNGDKTTTVLKHSVK